MGELPRVFASKIEKDIKNNEDFSVSKKEDNRQEMVDDKNIYQKINDIFSSYKYVYKADVVITTDEGEFVKKIIGKNGNNLITIDNEIINIDSIRNIKFRNN